MVRRSKIEIYMAVLDALSDTDKPTRVMYKANLSWTSLQNSFSTLIANGLVVVGKRGKSKIYKRTNKGDRALKYHKLTLKELIKDDNK